MINTVLGEMAFNTGFKTECDISLFGKKHNIIVKAKAYFEKDGITAEQEKAFIDFSDKKAEYEKAVENLLKKYSNNASEHLTPQTFLFQRDGSFALLCDDANEPDDGIAVCLSPESGIVGQDEYL
jgi:hypothetical protein